MKIYLLLFVLCLTGSIYSQDLITKVPEKSPFVMCFNGKNLNDKVTIKTIQEYPWMQTFLEKEFKNFSKDLSQTGIDFLNNQYQYYINKDSVKSYVVLLPLANREQFEKFVQSKNGDSIRITQKTKYSSISTSKTSHIAWNDKFAILVNGTYTMPYKYDNYEQTEIAVDTVAVTAAPAYDYQIATDSVAVAVAPAYDYETIVSDEPVATPPTKKATKYSKGKKKHSKGKKKKKRKNTPTIAAAVEPTEEEIYATEMEASTKLEDQKIKKTDSIEQRKIQSTIDLLFEETFNFDNTTAQKNNEITKKIDPKSDAFVWINLSNLTEELYKGYNFGGSLSGLSTSGMLDSDFYMNGYFEKDKIRLSQVMAPKNEETKKLIGDMFETKINKNLLNYVGEDVLAYYSIAMNTEAIMKYQYSVLRSTLTNMYKVYTKEDKADNIDVVVDALEIFLDEKAISEILPGDGIFVLHDLKSVQKEYTTYEYNDEYEKIEKKGIKEEITPDFSFVCSSKNETFVNKLLQLPLHKKMLDKFDYKKKEGYYQLHFEKNNVLEDLYFGIKNGVIMITTSKQNIDNLIQNKKTNLKENIKKAISKNASAVWFDVPKILAKTKKAYNNESQNNYYAIALKNAGEIAMESKFKKDALITESTYTINGEHENSLQYLFNVINELYLESKKEKPTTQE